MNSNNYKQYDTRWAKLGYPNAPWYIRDCGCGEVAVCNCIIEMDKYKKETPKTIQPFCKQYAAPNGNGTYFSGIPAMMKHYGMTEVKECDTMTELFKEMAKGNRVAILLMGSRNGGSRGVHWTSSAHFVAAVGYKKSGGKDYLYIKDSNSTSTLRNGWLAYTENLKGDVSRVWSGRIPAKKKEYVPTTAYKGKLPSKTVKRGDKGEQVKRLKEFLKWRYNFTYSNDSFGAGTEKAVKAFQRKYAKQYGLKVDGVFGKASKQVAQKIVDKYAKKYPTQTKQDKMLAWAKKIAGEKYHYVTWQENVPKTHTCPICSGRKYDDAYGWNCIGYAWASWRHGGQLGSNCSCAVFTDYHYNQLTRLPYDEASAMARQRIGLNDVYLIRDPNGLSLSKLKAGDVIAYFTRGGSYIHTALYIGNGQIADCTSSRADGIKYGVNSYSNYVIKLAFRYTGK